jgi:hypothetical protein
MVTVPEDQESFVTLNVNSLLLAFLLFTVTMCVNLCVFDLVFRKKTKFDSWFTIAFHFQTL